MARILIAECKQEVSSFNPVPSHYEDFAVAVGEELFEVHRQMHDEVGGALSVLDRQSDFELIPTFGARAITSGGTLASSDFDRLSEEFLDALRKAPPADAAYFAMHGAMAAENELDPEGFLLAQAREILGEEIPIVVSLDLHGILTDRMLQHADAVVVYHTYPHVDFFETGARAARLLTKIVTEGVRPVTARIKIPALVRGDELITETGLLGHCIRIAQEIESRSDGLSAGMLIGNPFTDVPELCTSSLVVTDGDQETADKDARKLADIFWQHHEQMQMPLVPLKESLQIAKDTEGTVVLMDAADATSSGASGDSNAILREMITAGYQGRALIPIVDPEAAAQALEAGVGATIQTTVGGALDPARFEPLEITAKVRLLSDGHFLSESFGQPWYSGDTALLEADNFTILVASRAVSLYDRAFFLAHGQDPQRFDAVVVKSPHCEPHMFANWCARLLNVDALGSTSANLKSLGHTQCARPMFPLEDDVEFAPEVELYQRGR